VSDFPDVFGKFDITLAVKISDQVIPSFKREEYDELYVIYNEFRNIAVQKPSVVRLFPLPPIGKDEDVDPNTTIEYIYEPSDEVLLDKLLYAKDNDPNSPTYGKYYYYNGDPNNPQFNLSLLKPPSRRSTKSSSFETLCSMRKSIARNR
jgi:hypothetical protein